MFNRIQQIYRPVPPRHKAGPLRCLFVITSMPVGGAETLLVNLMRRMDPEVMIPEVVCLKEAGPLGEQIASEFKIHTHLLSSKYDLRVLPRLVQLMYRRWIDVVITVGAGDKMFWGRIAAKLAGVPVIASALHSTGWPDGVGRLNRKLTCITDAFIAVADSHGEFLTSFERFPAAKVNVIRNGVDCDRFRNSPTARESLREQLGIPIDAPVVGLVAALRSEKNHSMFLNTAAMIRDQNCDSRLGDTHWVLVGDGPERPAIEKLRDELNLGSRVHLLGTRHDTPELVAGMDVFALTSLNEASPVSILESLACGVPVVATDVGSISESVIEGVTGHLVPSEDVPAMAAAVTRLLNDPAAARRMGENGRDRVVATGSLDSMVRGYQSLATRLYDSKVRSVPCLAPQGGKVSTPREASKSISC
ncbi:Glycosyl transferase, group 1 domain protein [Rhodopirellula maiorica SM1]|uniref:Glycosyl transferase, group 1 domain protein n=1 Tax=Rhodopirellula maiorica SM1 TaxID=1265738 RepID=M5RND6_9BACT|nr:glycosyltransferase [Rhodopirellula maiorica]EMI20828.1 Glycosyl transferase, group 1 domain protein [Rhodopirellula maiorica SM1]